MGEWGVKVNLAEPRSAVRTRAMGWVVNTNPGWGGERLCIHVRSRSGKMITTWIGAKRLTNFRAAWMPEKLRDKCHAWSTKESAEAWCSEMNK